MSLSRAFTTRRGRGDASDSAIPQRSLTAKGSMNIRSKISGPVELVHTTNMLSYNAPDLPRSKRHGLPAVSTASSSSKSEDDSDTLNTIDSTPPTSPDVAPGERSSSPDPTHLSTYFMAPLKPTPAPPGKASPITTEAPAIPKRSPSHTKKASYDAINRQQSMSRSSKASDNTLSTKPSMTFSRSSSTSTNASHLSTHSRKLSAPPRPAPLSPGAMQATPTKELHPFGQELAQVTELVEEMTVKPQLTEEMAQDEKYIVSRDLVKFGIDEYLSIVEDLAGNFFPETTHIRAAGPLWI